MSSPNSPGWLGGSSGSLASALASGSSSRSAPRGPAATGSLEACRHPPPTMGVNVGRKSTGSQHLGLAGQKSSSS